MVTKKKRPYLHCLSILLGLTQTLNCLANAPSITYVVRPGENLDRISQKYLLPKRNWQDLAETNKLSAPHALKVGQRLQIPIAWLAARPADVKLVRFSGEVHIGAFHSGWKPAQINAKLQTGQRIKLGDNSSAVILFADGSELALQPNSELELDTLTVYAGGHMTDTRVRLQAGRVEVRANPRGIPNQRLDIFTPSAITAVRGTQFLVEAQASNTLTQTTEGKVELKNSLGNTTVAAGYGSLVTQGERPSAPTLTKSAPELNRPATRFNDFPIQFGAVPQTEVNAWVAQAGLSDRPQMATLAKQVTSISPNFELGPLENGSYQLRTWSIDEKGMPSKISLHPFEVDIPRKLQESSVIIQASLVAKGFELHLTSPPNGLRYLLQLTKDAQGKQNVWYAYNAPNTITLPPQNEAAGSDYHLWIWVY